MDLWKFLVDPRCVLCDKGSGKRAAAVGPWIGFHQGLRAWYLPYILGMGFDRFLHLSNSLMGFPYGLNFNCRTVQLHRGGLLQGLRVELQYACLGFLAALLPQFRTFLKSQLHPPG